MLQAQGQRHLPQLARGRARAGDQELHRLLGDRRSTLHHPLRAEVAPERARDGRRIDTGMAEEPRILGGEGGAHEVLREAGRIHAPIALAPVRQRLVQRDTVTVDDLRGDVAVEIEHPGRERPAADPHCRGHERGRRRDAAPAPRRAHPGRHRHGRTVTRSVDVRPNTSGSYISSACAGAVRNVPAVVARATYEKTCSPSARRVAKSSTRSSWRSTRSKPPRSHQAIQPPAVPGPTCSRARSAAVVANQDSTASNPAGSGSVTAT